VKKEYVPPGATYSRGDEAKFTNHELIDRLIEHYYLELARGAAARPDILTKRRNELRNLGIDV